MVYRLAGAIVGLLMSLAMAAAYRFGKLERFHAEWK
jgi:hypothetical protein